MHVVLIQAHADPEHFGRLARALASPRLTLVAHVDAKSDIGPFRRAAEGTGLVFSDRRARVVWLGWSQVEATLAMLETARRVAPEFRTASLVSGSHFPLRAPEALADALDALEVERIEDQRMPTHARAGESIRLRKRFYAGGIRGDALRRTALGALNRGLRRLPDRRFPAPLGPDAFRRGSQWWTLGRETLDAMARFRVEHRAADRFFRRTFCPDEIYFPTLAGMVARRPVSGLSSTYLEWAEGHDGSPRLLDARALDRLLSPGFLEGRPELLFARKFGSRENPQEIARLEAALRGG